MSHTTPIASRPHMPGYGLSPVDDEHGTLPFSWAEERLGACRSYWISSTRPDGAPHCMPVWGLWHAGAFLFNTARDSRKARNLAADPRCVVSTESADEPVIVEGTCAEIRDAQRIADFYARYQAKYDTDLAQIGAPSFVVTPRVVFGFVEAAEEFPTSATRWRFPE